jgi:hypothetical protein
LVVAHQTAPTGAHELRLRAQRFRQRLGHLHIRTRQIAVALQRKRRVIARHTDAEYLAGLDAIKRRHRRLAQLCHRFQQCLSVIALQTRHVDLGGILLIARSGVIRRQFG